LVCKEFAKRQGWKFNFKAYQSRFLVKEFQGVRVVFALPQTYMNRSGPAVAEILQKFPAVETDRLVIVDDFQIPFGSIRFRGQGSSGGHKGLESVQEHIGDNYPRLRLGIGPKPPQQDIVKFVLGRWTRTEKQALKIVMEKAIAGVEAFIAYGIETAMSRHNDTAAVSGYQ
jgi:PTH1 family peptidyl-tRNA hydrolase